MNPRVSARATYPSNAAQRASLKEYKSPGRFKGGAIYGVAVSVEKAEYTDLQQEAKRMLLKQ